MATPKSQRVGIWVIAIVLTLGTLGSFLVMALSVQNQKVDQNQIQKLTADYQAATAKQAKNLSDKYYKEFSKYATKPAVYDAATIKEVSISDIKIGIGEVLKANTAYSAYYIGWNPKGVVFDQSIDGDKLKSPIAGGNLITGWNEGVLGMKVGGIREISIPSEKAYGASGSGENIPANTPIKFIVMVIPKVTEIPIPQALLDYYQNQNSGAKQ